MKIDYNKILKYHFKNGLLIWPFLRTTLVQVPFSNVASIPKTNWRTILFNLLKGLKICRIKKAETLFFTAESFNVKSNGSYKNILVDYYYDLIPGKKLICEFPSSYTYQWRFPRAKPISSLFTYLDRLIGIITKFWFWYSPSEDINKLVDELTKEKWANDLSQKKIHDLLIHRDKRYRVAYPIYKRVLKYISPKLVFVNCASYGNMWALIAYISKELGAKVIEMQHGQTSNIAYIYNEIEIQSKEYGQYLPDAIFTFGEFWHSFTHTQSEKIVMGHPHITNSVKTESLGKKEILFISQYTVYNELSNLAKELSKILPSDYKIIYRLHPMENPAIDRVREDFKATNVVVSTSKVNWQEAFNNASHIVAVSSLCVYEALAFKRPVFLLDHELSQNYIDESVGIRVKSAMELKEGILSGATRGEDSSKFWAEDFEIRLKNYLKTIDFN